MIPTQRSAALFSALVLAFATIVYFLTLTPTVPFWDSGEFIAVSTILGVPHPPGTPFYVLLGRIATLIPWASIAQRVNALSAVAAALTVWLTYLSTLRLIRLAQGAERKDWHEWVATASAAAGALMLAFSDVFWENSVEAEVYQLMSLAQILVFWLGLRWWEAHDRKPTVGPLLLATYVMWLCVGLHLGVGIMGLPLIVLVFLVDRPVAILFAMPFLSLLRVPAGLENAVDAIALLSAATLWWLSSRRRAPSWTAWLASVPFAVSVWEMLVGAFLQAGLTQDRALAQWFVDTTTHPMYYLAVIGLLALAFLGAARERREGRVLLLSLLLMVAGYSTHLYLPIRAAQHPAVNEGAPATWDKMRDLLERKQYGEMSMTDSNHDGAFDRKEMTDLSEILYIQLYKEFWRYFERQWPLFGSGMAGSLLPLLLGLLGGWWLFTREKKSFAMSFVFLGLSTAGMIAFLNFSNHEVRDRDYFFQSGFHAFAMWMGLGIAWMVEFVRGSFAEDSPTQRIATGAATGLLGLMPIVLLANHWYTHDRSGNYIAGDYAYNMLATLKPNSFMFTNGDNDTFPLWYIQEVEGFRKDVRIVNLSLLNTDWYIRQLRDQEPKVPIALDDRTVDALGSGYFQDEQGNIVMTSDFMVQHILEHAKRDTGWVKQPYFAVTVPKDFGYDAFLRQEGIVQEVMRDSLQAGFDEAATRKALYETYKYRGLFLPDGTFDPKVYKDSNAENLSRNYAFAHMQLGMHYARDKQYPKAIAEMEHAQRMFPTWVEMILPLGRVYMAAGDTAGAMRFYDQLVARTPDSAPAHSSRGEMLEFLGRPADAAQAFRRARELDPDFPNGFYYGFANLWDLGRYEEAVMVLQQWVDRHPNDNPARAQLEQARMRLGQGMNQALPGGPPGLR